MFKQVFKLTVVTWVWKRYKAAIVSTLLLFVYYWLVEKIHADYLNYLSLSSDGQGLGTSFILKWLFLITGLCLYLVFNFIRKRALNPKLPHVEKPRQANKKTTKNQNPASTGVQDPFAQLRGKKPLRSKADFVIDQDKK